MGTMGASAITIPYIYCDYPMITMIYYHRFLWDSPNAMCTIPHSVPFFWTFAQKGDLIGRRTAAGDQHRHII